MISNEEYQELLTVAAQAPSGDNAQPWRFVVNDNQNQIDIYNITGKDSSPYNFKERGSLFAHGAVLENLSLILSSRGYGMTVDLFPDQAGAGTDHVATVTISPENGANDSLVDAISLRTTNRKPYKNMPLAQEDKNVLINAVDGKRGALRIIEDKSVIKRLAKILSLSDQLIFEDKTIHDAIFSSIRWTKEDEERKKGLYIKTLELPSPARVLFKNLQRWGFLTAMNRIGISKFIASQSEKNYAASSAFGVVVIHDKEPKSFVEGGRLFQRLWLIATQRGISIQPVTALPYLAQRIHENAPLDLSPLHQSQILAAEKEINDIVEIQNGSIAMIFRMGYGENPSARSQKSSPEITYT
jgi:Nitroreductase family